MVVQNKEIKLVRSLREKKFRDEHGLFVVEGEKMVKEALMSDFEVRSVYRKEEVGESAMERMSQLATAPPVLAVVSRPSPCGFQLRKGLFLALDGVRDPGNMGTIIRLADWFGIDTVLVSEDSVELFNPKVIQASMGSIFRIKVVSCDIADACRRFKEAGMPVYGTFLDGEDIYASNLAPEGLIVMGNESDGVSKEVAELVDSRLLIPSFASGRTAESLNVATATAITLSEFRRR